MYKKRKDTSIIVIVLEKVSKSIKSCIVFGVVTSHYISHTKNKCAKAKFSGQSIATCSWLSYPQKAHLS